MTGSALALFAWRAPAFRTGALFSALSREYAITLNNLLLLVSTAVVFLGTFYPVFMDVLHGDKISVGPPYYRATFVPLFLALFVLSAFGPMLNWKRDTIPRLLARLRGPAILAGGMFAIIGVAFGPSRAFAALGLALGVWLIAGAGAILARRWRVGEVPRGEALSLARATPLAVWGLVIAHAGLGVTAIGVTAVGTWQTNKVLSMRVGQSAGLAGNTITLTALRPVEGPNYEADQARFEVKGAFGRRTLVSERRLYEASQTTTTDAGIGVGVLGNIYISIADRGPDGGLTVRMWNHPFVDWIWAGGLLMAFGGMVSLADRGLRVARVERAPARAMLAEATAS